MLGQRKIGYITMSGEKEQERNREEVASASFEIIIA
jgi:hypothetical protein